MSKARSRRRGWFARTGLATAMLTLAAAAPPATATPGPTVTYQAPISLPCMLAPGVLNTRMTVTMAISAQGPAFVESGDAFSLQGADVALTLPSIVGTSFAGFGSQYLGGDWQHLTLDGTGTTPSSIDAAQESPYNAFDMLEFDELGQFAGSGAGLPLGPVPVLDGAPMNLTVPVAVQTPTDTTATPPLTYQQPDGPQNVPPGSTSSFGVGPYTVTGAAGGDVNLSIGTTAAFAGPPYTITGGGTLLTVAGSTDNPMTPDGLDAGPLSIACNPTASGGVGPSVATAPIVAPVQFGQPSFTQTATTETITVPTTGTPAPTFQWQASTNGGTTWTPISGANSDSLTIPLPQPANSEYELTATNSVSNPSAIPSGPFVVSTATIRPVGPPPPPTPPVITQQPANAAVTPGQTATFTAAATGSGPPTVQWQVSTDGGTTWTNDTTDSGATTDTLTVASTTAPESGDEYRAVFTNGFGSTTSDAATLTVSSGGPPPVITTQPTNQSVCGGGPATFTAAASGAPAPTVQWQVSTDGGATWTNDTTDGGATTATLTIARTTAALSGNQYRAVFTNTAGSATTNAATLTVFFSPAIVTEPSSVTVNEGATATFTATPGGAPCGPGVDASPQWQVSTDGGTTWTNDTTDSGATTDTLTVGPVSRSQNGSEYRAVFTTSFGAATTTAATLTVRYAPTVTQQPVNETIALAGTATFTAAANGNPPPTVQWQVSTDGGATWSNDTTDSGATTPTLSVLASLSDCAGYEYRAVFTNSIGSATTNAASLTTSSPPIVATQPTSQTVTAGQDASFTVAVGGCAILPPTVQWQVSSDAGATFVNDTTDAGTTTDTLTVASTTVAENGYRYRAVFTNSVGTFDSSAATLTVDYAPMITTDPANASVNPGATETFTAAASGNPAPTVQWQSAASGNSAFTDIAGATSTTLTLTGVTASQSGGRYRAVFSNSVGTATSNAATLTVAPPPNTPVVTGVFPSRGSRFSVVVITGKNLNRASKVAFGSVRAPFFLRLSSTLIIALAPPQASGTTVDVTVTTPVGTSAATSADRFSYT